MTQAEIEASLERLNAQLAQLRHDQEHVRKAWRFIGPTSIGLGLLLAAAGLVYSIMSYARELPNSGAQFLLPAIPLVLLVLALVTATRQGIKR